MIKNFPFYGTVSHGTMRNEDLIPRFADVLHSLSTTSDGYQYFSLVKDARNVDDYDSEDADYILDELFHCLNYFAPGGYYFGAHPGDGSDFGFWQVDCDE